MSSDYSINILEDVAAESPRSDDDSLFSLVDGDFKRISLNALKKHLADSATQSSFTKDDFLLLSIAISNVPELRKVTIEQLAAVLYSALTPGQDEEAANKRYVDTEDAKRLLLSGGTMTGNINMNNHSLLAVTAMNISGAINMFGTGYITNCKALSGLNSPTANDAATNKKYVDDADALSEKLANKATVIDDNADNTKYPTSLAVKNHVADSLLLIRKKFTADTNHEYMVPLYSVAQKNQFYRLKLGIRLRVKDYTYTADTITEGSSYWSAAGLPAVTLSRADCEALTDATEVSLPFGFRLHDMLIHTDDDGDIPFDDLLDELPSLDGRNVKLKVEAGIVEGQNETTEEYEGYATIDFFVMADFETETEAQTIITAWAGILDEVDTASVIYTIAPTESTHSYDEVSN